MKKSKRYRIEVSEDQLRLIINCVEDCHRFMGGQMELQNTTDCLDNWDEVQEELAKKIKPSPRGELEITTLNDMYLKEGRLNGVLLGSGFTWFDTGTNDSMVEATNLIRGVQKNQDRVICSPEAVAFKKGWISRELLQEHANEMIKNALEKKINATEMNQMVNPQPMNNMLNIQPEPIYQPLSEQKPNIPPQNIQNFPNVELNMNNQQQDNNYNMVYVHTLSYRP